jgi:hypothetical protein
VFARLLGDGRTKRLFTQEITISREIAASLAEPGTGVYFDWGPDSARYVAHFDKWEALPDPRDFVGVADPSPVA